MSEVVRVISQDGSVSLGLIQGRLYVEPGVTADLLGTVQGAIDIAVNASVTFVGAAQGEISLEPGALLVVSGQVQGSVVIAEGARLEIARDGSFWGLVQNEGTMINVGYRQAVVEGDGTVEDRDGAKVAEPERGADGSYHFKA